MTAYRFDDAEGYDRLMSRWSRAAGEALLTWAAPRKAARWLDVGCGTGSFTDLIVETCHPSRVVAIDAEPAQVVYANDRFALREVQVGVADACLLPFESRSFDVVASALVLNFIPDIPRCLSEMARVAAAEGLICGYVWDFAGERSPTWPLREALKCLGYSVPAVPGASQTSRSALRTLLAAAGLRQPATRAFEVKMHFEEFDEFWVSQIAGSPTGKMVGKLGGMQRLDLQAETRSQLCLSADGAFAYLARAHGFMGVA
ncbi:class I SAM-dependent methyltransferase [Bradyrhizobium canariense]|uniref:Methyltransferase type 11 domain-containing protein n=1 Tax=Bradyrhizobium canariense TaxID=255045 RepID=A0A1X3G737_9BRAD|nr:class I SAM-dependent methyltransferase [Bradyrhizobium canariense]OSI78928.1 hypothetical protein BSZ22_02285 [Bradyrhizobium canariense]OSI82296.1 hypothetical protein BSZ23_02290 [Bradyrhizobium canariense]OSI96535.1 hypothetical protein BSZ25_01940 [Bradyrhizobium canariense]OSI97842.1 hypothetical protein BSZ24_01980 [Bradyrhizobium canariense]OSJ15401.1 hypothetical protein BSZ16_01995 [Bradyrhizobium canariense]